MDQIEVAAYMREKYSADDYRLLVLTVCALLVTKAAEEVDNPTVGLLNDTLNDLRSSMTDEETLKVAAMMAEIDDLRALTDTKE